MTGVLRPLHQVLLMLLLGLVNTPVRGNYANNLIDTGDVYRGDQVHQLVRRWAPLIMLAPGERFLPSSVPYFLQNAVPTDPLNKDYKPQDLPYGINSDNYYLFTRKPVEQLLMNASSFLYGQNPQKMKVPAYAVVTRCQSTKYSSPWYTNTLNQIKPNKRNFHVTYWFFYPFNEGKNVCTLSLGILGPVPIPKMFNKCLGEQQYIGSHVGDWEHLSLYFNDYVAPESMYISTHDAGAYYKFDRAKNYFIYERQETRKGILQKPKFPRKALLLHGQPLLYSAKGSHGLWSEPGNHRYLTVPRLYDKVGNGIPWKTWESLEIIDPPYTSIPNWLKYRGKWGNTKSACHPLNKVGINICQLSDGPTGIPLKRLNFVCPKIK